MNRCNADRLVLTEKDNNYERADLNQKNKQYYAAYNNSASRKKIDYNLTTLEREKQSGKYDKDERNQKYQQNYREEYVQPKNREICNAFNDCSKFDDVSLTSNCKRENARKWGFQMRVNNIENINDKINNLLNMVKKDKKSQKNDQKDNNNNQCYNQVKNPSLSPTKKIDLDIKIKRQCRNMSPFECKSISKQNQPKISLFEQNYDLKSKPDQRNRAISALNKINQQQNPRELSNNGRFKNKYLLNDEDKDYTQSKVKKTYERQQTKYEYKQNWQERVKSKIQQNVKDFPSDKKYSQIKNSYDLLNSQNKSKDIDKMLEERRKLREKQRQIENSKFQYKYPVQQQSSFAGKWAQEQKIQNKFYPVQTPFKYDRIYEQCKNIQTYLPVSLLKDSAPAQRNEKISSTTRLIDEQIKRIKSKMQQSQSNNTRIQQKLTDARNEDDSFNYSYMAEKIYNKNRASPIKYIQSKRSDGKQNTIKLASILSQQVQFDCRLRGVREAFDKTADEKIWNELHQKLSVEGYNFSLIQLKRLIKISPDEHNPFGNDKNASKCSSDLLQLFIQAQSNWENYVCQGVNLKLLKSEGFDINDLDLSKKGYLSIQDLVCFINLHTGQFYRNRDISLIFRRLQIKDNQQNSSGIQYTTFLSTLTT